MVTFKNYNFELDDLIPGSKYFKWKEALYLKSVDGFALPNREQRDNIIELAKALDKVREYYREPIYVTSWLRPKNYNLWIGGALKSQHMLGKAVDFTVRNEKPEHVRAELIRRKDIWPYRGEIHDGNWIHLDMGGTTWFHVGGR